MRTWYNCWRLVVYSHFKSSWRPFNKLDRLLCFNCLNCTVHILSMWIKTECKFIIYSNKSFPSHFCCAVKQHTCNKSQKWISFVIHFKICNIYDFLDICDMKYTVVLNNIRGSSTVFLQQVNLNCNRSMMCVENIHLPALVT